MVRWCLQHGWPVLLAATFTIAVAGLSYGQAADEQTGDDGSARQAEPSLRFTPDMARGMGAIYVREMLKNRYELPEDKMAEASEKIARRLMQMAHKIDKPGYELIERFIEEQLAHAGRGGDGMFMPPGFGKEFADRVLPLLPEIRELARGVAQDVRPMLPMKKQFQMAGEMMAFKTFMDGFEESMKKWSSGEVTKYEDPFHQAQAEKKNDKGETPSLEYAHKIARHEAEGFRANQWKSYLNSFKTLYELDGAQMATAESVLREYTQREKTITAKPEWSKRVYKDQLWVSMSYQMPSGWMHPARALLEDDLANAKAPVDRLEEEFKTRLESIPTRAQRMRADERVAGLLSSKGLIIAATQPQPDTEAKP